MSAGGEYYPPCAASNSVCMTDAHSIDEQDCFCLYIRFLRCLAFTKCRIWLPEIDNCRPWWSWEGAYLASTTRYHGMHQLLWTWGLSKGPTAFKLHMVCCRGSLVLFTEIEQVWHPGYIICKVKLVCFWGAIYPEASSFRITSTGLYRLSTLLCPSIHCKILWHLVNTLEKRECWLHSVSF